MNENVLIYCTKCSRQLEVPKNWLGKKGECPYCGEKFIINKPKSQSLISFKGKFYRVASIVVCLVFIYIFSGGVLGAYKAIANKPVSQECKILKTNVDEFFGKLKDAGIISILNDEKGLWVDDVKSQKLNRDAIVKSREAAKSCIKAIDARMLEVKISNNEKMRQIVDAYQNLHKISDKLIVLCDKMERIHILRLKPLDENDSKIISETIQKFKDLEEFNKYWSNLYKEYIKLNVDFRDSVKTFESMSI